MVLGQYNLVLLGIKWNWVSTRLLCLYILKKVEIWLDVTIAGRTNEQTTEQGKIELLSQYGPWTAEMSNNLPREFSSIVGVLISRTENRCFINWLSLVYRDS